MESPPLRRRRPALSCIRCRQRKLKCDRNDPCARCIATDTSCTYRSSRAAPSARLESQQNPPRPRPLVSSTPPPRVHSSTPGRAAGASSLSESSLPWTAAAAAATVTPKQHDPSTLLGHGHARSTGPSSNEAVGSTDLPRQVSNLDRPDTATVTSGPSRRSLHLETRPSGPQSFQIVLNKNRMLRWSHWIGTAKEFGTVVDCYIKYVTATVPSDETLQSDEVRALATQIGGLIQACKIEARRTKIGRPTRSLPSYQFDLAVPPRTVADSMVDKYIASFESAYRIFHIPSFRAEYESFWNQAGKVSTGLRLKILLVIGIGSSLDERAVADWRFRGTVHDWVCAAQVWLSGPLEKDRLDIPGLQIHCLTLLAREIFSIGGDLIWVSTGSLMHQAMQMGLHRDPKHFPNMSILQAETRRKLWATILEMVLQSSLDSALPARISLDEFDTEAPSNVNDDEMDQSTTAIQPHPRNVVTSTSIQLLLLDSLPTRLRILQLLNDLRTEIAYSDVLMLDSEINAAIRACNGLGIDADGYCVSQFHRNLLDYLVRRFLIPLHCPFASQARTNRMFNYSLEASLSASLALVTAEPDESFTRLMTLGGGLLREGIRCASSVISLELLAKVETQRLDGTLQRGSWQREVLKRAMYDMIASSSERIRLGETNIKAHMFLNMIMAQVEAVEKGLPCEAEIAKSAKHSLTFCHDLISRRADGVPFPGSAGDGLTPSINDYGQDVLGLDLDLDTNTSLDFFLPNDTFY